MLISLTSIYSPTITALLKARTKKQPRDANLGADNYALFTYFLEITGPILRRPDGRVTGWSRAAGITAPSKERSLSGYPSDSLPLL